MTPPPLDAAQREQIRERIAQGKRAAPVLERVRREDIRRADTGRAMEQLNGFVLAHARRVPPRPTSGLVEQQRVFQRAAPRHDRPA